MLDPKVSQSLLCYSLQQTDPDLGAPNMRCDNPGPGVGEGGEPDGAGPNCAELGNVLIIQNATATCPDDDEDGGECRNVLADSIILNDYLTLILQYCNVSFDLQQE